MKEGRLESTVEGSGKGVSSVGSNDFMALWCSQCCGVCNVAVFTALWWDSTKTTVDNIGACIIIWEASTYMLYVPYIDQMKF
eukprot:13193175-Ditylum_brightwellii.AAC.1